MSKTTKFVNLLTFTHLEITLLKVPHLCRFFQDWEIQWQLTS